MAGNIKRHKHIPIKCPKGDGSTFFNYKGFHSIVLLGLVDSEYKFIFTDVGCQGRISHGGAFRNTELYNRLISNELNLLDPMELQEVKTLRGILQENRYVHRS